MARAALVELASEGRAVVSTQVLQEFFFTATKKLRLSPELARKRVVAYSRLDVVLIRPELVLAASDLSRLHSLPFWDALVVRSAAVSGCARLLSEDLSGGQIVDGVRIENPFRR